MLHITLTNCEMSEYDPRRDELFEKFRQYLRLYMQNTKKKKIDGDVTDYYKFFRAAYQL